MPTNRTLIPIFTTRGDLGAFLSYPYIFNRQGDWIGWVNQHREVYSVVGQFAGTLSNEPRILRRAADSYDRPRQKPPPPPPRISIPATQRLAPMMPELPFGVSDVLDDDPDLLPVVDFGVYGKDMD
jgi:hypothetical protein